MDSPNAGGERAIDVLALDPSAQWSLFEAPQALLGMSAPRELGKPPAPVPKVFAGGADKVQVNQQQFGAIVANLEHRQALISRLQSQIDVSSNTIRDQVCLALSRGRFHPYRFLVFLLRDLGVVCVGFDPLDVYHHCSSTSRALAPSPTIDSPVEPQPRTADSDLNDLTSMILTNCPLNSTASLTLASVAGERPGAVAGRGGGAASRGDHPCEAADPAQGGTSTDDAEGRGA